MFANRVQISIYPPYKAFKTSCINCKAGESVQWQRAQTPILGPRTGPCDDDINAYGSSASGRSYCLRIRAQR